MADIARRAHARHACDKEVEIYSGATGKRLVGTGQLLDLSLSGGYLRFSGELNRGLAYVLRIEEPNGTLDLPCRVAREGSRGGPKHPGTRHYGLSFNLTSGQEASLRRLLDRIRREPPPGEERIDRFMRDYWSI